MYDGLNPVQELNSSNRLVANLMTGLRIDEYFGRTASGTTSTFLGDALGSTIGLVSASNGSLATNYTHQPFGATTRVGPDTSNSFEFTGRENDGTGLYFYRARYYSPTYQRFIAPDPIGFAGGTPDLYGYTFNDPNDFRDPNGRELVGAVLGGIVGGLEGGLTAAATGGTYGQIAIGALAGFTSGALIGALNPFAPVFELAAAGGAGGFFGDFETQLAAPPCKPWNVGELVGATVGGALTGALAQAGALQVLAGDTTSTGAAAGVAVTITSVFGPIGPLLGAGPGITASP